MQDIHANENKIPIVVILILIKVGMDKGTEGNKDI